MMTTTCDDVGTAAAKDGTVAQISSAAIEHKSLDIAVKGFLRRDI
jgi:hypothetical protein